MVINSVDFDIKNGLLICSTDRGITLYSVLSNEISKIKSYEILEGCRVCKLVKSNKPGDQTMSAFYLPKASITEYCVRKIMLPSHADEIEDETLAHINDNVGNYDYHSTTPVSNKIVTSRSDVKIPIRDVFATDEVIILIHDRKISGIGRKTYNTLFEINTCLNMNGVSLISTQNNILQIFTLGQRCGEVLIASPSKNDQDTIKSHNHEIRCIATDSNMRYLATTSVNGTIINVYDLMTLERIFRFRRGKPSATIYSLAISDDLKWLACCSSRGTLHMWILDATQNPYEPSPLAKKASNGVTYLKSWFPTYSNYLGDDSIVNESTSAVKHDLGCYENHICKFDKSGLLHIATIDGKYYKVHTPDLNYKYITDAKNLCVIDD